MWHPRSEAIQCLHLERKAASLHAKFTHSCFILGPMSFGTLNLHVSIYGCLLLRQGAADSLALLIAVLEAISMRSETSPVSVSRSPPDMLCIVPLELFPSASFLSISSSIRVVHGSLSSSMGGVFSMLCYSLRFTLPTGSQGRTNWIRKLLYSASIIN